MHKQTNVPKLASQERIIKILNLRRAGASYNKIADEVECSTAYCHQVVTKEMRKVAETLGESAKEIITLELERLDELFNAVWTKAKNGEIKSVNAALRIMERRANILGLDTVRPQDETRQPVTYIVQPESEAADWSKAVKFLEAQKEEKVITPEKTVN